MEILIEQAQGRVPVTVLRVKGDWDGTNYQKLINFAQAQYNDGARDFLGGARSMRSNAKAARAPNRTSSY